LRAQSRADPPGIAPVVHQARCCARDRRGNRDSTRCISRPICRICKWQPTDCEANLEGIGLWVAEAALPNLRAPMKLDVRDSRVAGRDGRLRLQREHCAHHGLAGSELMFAGIARVLRPRGMFALYGPVQSRWPVHQRVQSGIRRIAALSATRRWDCATDQALKALGRQHGLAFTAEHAMPANNRLLIWTR
jgi:hypothetical protein